MDWPRAKTVLIFAFLALNIALAAQLYLIPLFDLSARPADAADIEGLLVASGVELPPTMPRRGPSASFALLANPAFSSREITDLARRLLSREGVRVDGGEGLGADAPVVYSGEPGQTVVVTAGGLVTYEHNQLPPITATNFDAEVATRVAADFVRHRLGADWFVFEGATQLGSDEFRVDYLQRFRGGYIFPGYATLVVRPEGVVAMWMHRLRVSFEAGTNRRALSAIEAVLSLTNHRQNAGEQGGIVVQAVDFGFHSPIYDTGDATWRAVPVWRLRTSRGEFLINAHSGVIETR